jgi:hypothetical protein
MEVEADQIRNLRDADVPSLSSAVHEDMRIKRVLLVNPDTGLSIEADIARWIIDGGEDGAPVGRLAKAGVEILRAPDSELQESLTQFLREPDADLVATDVLLSNALDRSDVGTSTDLGGEGQSALGFE